MYHPLCPKCRSPKTIRHGGGRWICKRASCGKTFTLRRKDRRDRTAIEAYVGDRTTYARLGRRWGVNRSTAYRRVLRALLKRYSVLDRTKRSLEACDRACVLDGKTTWVGNKTYTIFVAWDRGLGKPIHFLIKEGGEKELWYWRLLMDLRWIGYEPKAFVSDGIVTLKEFLAEMYPTVPHQRCAVHVFLSARGKVVRGKWRTQERTDIFVELLRRILWSRTYAEASTRWNKVWRVKTLTRNERTALELVGRALRSCFVCKDKRWKHLHLPRSSNAIENVMGQIEAELKTRRGSKSLLSLTALVNEVLLRVATQTITHN